MTRDVKLEDTVYINFTTRAFSSGVPTALAGTPALSVLEENNATPITAGVSVQVSRASVVGLNQATILATAANGYEAGKNYAVYISTGTVGGVSVVGEIVGEFTVQAAPVNWARVTAPTTAVDLSGTDIQLCDTITTYTGNTVQTGDSFARIGAPAGASVSADLADVPTVAEFEARTLVAASYFDPAVDVVANVTLVDQITSYTGNTPQTGDTFAIANGANGFVAIDTVVDAIKVVTDAIGTTGTGLTAIPWNAAWDAEVESEVNDALDTAIAELGVGAPTATPTLRTGLMLLYMALRNKTVVQTSGTDALEIYNNAGVKIAAKLLTDDGSDYTESEMA